jgi:hypothetical protein
MEKRISLEKRGREANQVRIQIRHLHFAIISMYRYLKIALCIIKVLSNPFALHSLAYNLSKVNINYDYDVV